MWPASRRSAEDEVFKSGTFAESVAVGSFWLEFLRMANFPRGPLPLRMVEVAVLNPNWFFSS